ncbi:MAG: hypothetical protein K0Q95_3083 [Bacteroidota bacterium]|jgi:hypothetical protein|nr:hypothetical protein [Bacteroidota bacterium]
MKHILLACALILAFMNSVIAKDEPGDYNEIDNSIIIDRISNDDVTVTIPSPVFSFREAEVKIKFHNPEHTKLLLNKNKVEFLVNGEPMLLDFANGEASFKHNFKNSNIISIYCEDLSYSNKVTVYPLWAILIPLAVILLYILKRLFLK